MQTENYNKARVGIKKQSLRPAIHIQTLNDYTANPFPTELHNQDDNDLVL